MADVFISYSSKDNASAEYLRDTIESMYLTCWMAPRDIPKGGNFAEMIPTAIRNAKVMLILVSQNSQSSVQVENELNFASHIGLPRISIQLDKSPLSNSFQYHIAKENRYDGVGRLAAVASEVVDRIHTEISKQAKKKEKSQDTTVLRKAAPLVWLLMMAGCAVILIGACCICLTLRLITLHTFLKATFFILLLVLLGASIIRTPLFSEEHKFYQKFLKLLEILRDRP